MPNPNIDRRSCSVELRAIKGEDERQHIRGHAAVFNSLSDEIWGFRERILPGAFKKALERSDVRALYNHNPDYVLGRNKANTLILAEDERGLAVDIIPPDTQVARDLITSIERGDIDQMSFAFTVAPGGDRWFTENGVTIREITEIDQLYDVSPVTYPAYPDTDVSARTQEALREYRSSQDAVGAGGPEGDAAAAKAHRARQIDLLELEII